MGAESPALPREFELLRLARDQDRIRQYYLIVVLVFYVAVVR